VVGKATRFSINGGGVSALAMVRGTCSVAVVPLVLWAVTTTV
jgi:hypothetical protein